MSKEWIKAEAVATAAMETFTLIAAVVVTVGWFAAKHGTPSEPWHFVVSFAVGVVLGSATARVYGQLRGRE